jgi:hypothetical protein
VVSRTGRNADEGDVVLVRSSRHHGERSVAAGDAERIRPVGNGFRDERSQALAGLQHLRGDIAFSRVVHESDAVSSAVTRRGVDEQHGPLGPLGRPPSIVRRLWQQREVSVAGLPSGCRGSDPTTCGSALEGPGWMVHGEIPGGEGE